MILQYDDIIDWFMGLGGVVMIIAGLVLFLLVLLLPIFLLKWGLNIVKADKATFGAAFVTYLLVLIIGGIVSWALSLLPPTIPGILWISLVVGLLVNAFIVSKRHNCSLVSGFLALFIPGLIISIIVVIIGLVLIFGFGFVLPAI